VDVRAFGAVGDGVTDDTAALAAALAASAGKTLLIPNGTFTTTAELLYDASANGPITIMGLGIGSVIKLTGTTNKGIYITGTAGVTVYPVHIKDLKILGATSGTSAAAIHLDGIAIYKITGIEINGNSKMTAGIRMTGSQQGEIGQGYIHHLSTGILFEPSGAIHSNGCDLHGMSLSSAGINVDIDTVDSIFMRGNHLVEAPISIDVHGGGLGTTNIAFNHIEQNTTAGVRIRDSAARVRVISNNFNSGTSGAFDLLVTSGNNHVIYSNLFTGSISFSSGVSSSTYANNLHSAGSFVNTFTDNTVNTEDSTIGMIKYGNRAVGLGASIDGATFHGDVEILGLAGYWGDIKIRTPGRGIVLSNSSDNVTKRVRLNDAGDGLTYEAE
jgi:hypothetical protein